MDKDKIRLKFRIVALVVLILGLIVAIVLDIMEIKSTTFIGVFQAVIVPLSGLLVADYISVPGKPAGSWK